MAAMLLSARHALAQGPAQPTAPPPPAQEGARPAVQNAADAQLLLALVRSKLIALHHANVTGNYTVLRDLGVSSFRDRNSATDLSGIFTNVRLARVDLSAVAALEPVLTTPAMIEGLTIRAQGAFDTKPVPIGFDMLLQPQDGAWRILGLSVTVLPAGSLPAATQPAQQPPAPSPSRPARGAPPAPPQRP